MAPKERETELARKLEAARRSLVSTRLRLLAADRTLAAVYTSRSWRATAPLRAVGRRCPSFVRASWLAFKALAWAATGQLPRRIKAWQEAARRGDETDTSSSQPKAPAGISAAVPAGRPRILLADWSVPQPDRGAGYRVTQAIIDTLLAEGWSVCFWPEDRAYRDPYTGRLESQGVTVIDSRLGSDLDAWLIKHGGSLEHVMLMRPHMSARLLPLVLCYTTAAISYYGHDLHFARLRDEAALTRDPDLAERANQMKSVERGIWRAVDVVIYPSVDEADTVRSLEPGVKACALPLFFYRTFRYREEVTKGATLLFVGGYLHRPNEDAAVFLAQNILPHIRIRCPSARLILVGADPTPRVKALASDVIEVTGPVDDASLKRLYETARVVLAPLRVGAGVKGKVVEALHEGVPVVTTPVGAQGMPFLERIVPVCEDEGDFVDSVSALLSDDSMWLTQSHAQTAYAQGNFCQEKFETELLTIVNAHVTA